ncbi:aspartyl-phosphate phosphatase Spo0E family protein [Clostridioides difficile]
MNRDKMYYFINEKGLNAKETIAASEELDQEVFKEMLKDPKIENIYLKQVVKAKEYRIEKLEEIIRNLRGARRANDLAELAVILTESGAPANESVRLSVYLGKVKGI